MLRKTLLYSTGVFSAADKSKPQSAHCYRHWEISNNFSESYFSICAKSECIDPDFVLYQLQSSLQQLVMTQNKVDAAPTIDIKEYPRAEAFVGRCREFFDEVKDL